MTSTDPFDDVSTIESIVLSSGLLVSSTLLIICYSLLKHKCGVENKRAILIHVSESVFLLQNSKVIQFEFMVNK